MDLTGIQFIDELELAEKRVFMRCDFNVPLDSNGNILDDGRILAAMPSIDYALENGAKLVLASHLGRPKGKVVPSLSMEPVAERLAEILDLEVMLPSDNTDHRIIDTLVKEMKGNQVVLLENLRFDPGEKKADPEFAAWLGSLADVYINDAFGAAHRAHASVYSMVKHFRRGHKAAGYLMRREINALSGLMTNPKRPFVAAMGGAKVSDKIGVLMSLLEQVDEVFIGGAMAYTFLKAQGVEVGSSRVEEGHLETAANILRKAKAAKKTIHLPVDHRIAEQFDVSSEAQVRTTNNATIPAGWMGLDIGPKTINAYKDVIYGAQTVFWNGPMGVFESEFFAEGTMSVARALADSKAVSVVGGGDSAAAIRKAGLSDSITHVSTGGGASLEFIEGKALPGIEALRNNHPFA